MRTFFSMLFCIGCYYGSQAQISDGSDSKHERWEYLLEDTGDVLQLALPISAAAMTLIKKDHQGTKNWPFPMVLHWQLPIL